MLKTDLETIVIPDGVNVGDIPTRSYDFNQGDNRFYSFANALEFASWKARETGVRRFVRRDTGPLGEVDGFWLVQEAGS